MSESKYTPGPWVLKYTGRINNPVLSSWYISANNIGIAVQTVYSDPAAAEANAHLIAAAPDLLEELEKAVRVMEAANISVDFVLPGLKPAIAKAKGETP